MHYESLAEELFEKFYKAIKQGRRNDDGLTEDVRGENFAVYFLHDAEKKVVPGEISAIMGVSTPRVASVLNSLEKKGFISREIDKTDRRKILVALTESGKLFAEEQRRKMFNKFTSLLRVLGEDDAREFIRILEKIIKLKGEECV